MRARQFPGDILPDLLRFFLPFFFTISGESSRQVTQMEERKSGRGPRKATPRSRRIFTGFLNSFTRLFLYVPITIVPGPSSTSEAPVPPPAPAAKRFYNALASVYLRFRLLSSAFILESGVDGKASREKRLQMAERLVFFGIADPRPLSTLPFRGFRLFPQECEGIASSLVFSRG